MSEIRPYFPDEDEEDGFYAEEDESLFREDSIFADGSDAETDLFDPFVNDYEEDQLDYLEEKLSLFPDSTGLLGSLIIHSMLNKEIKKANPYFIKLQSIPIEKHGFNTLVVEVKYMMLDPFNNEESIRRYLEYLKNNYPRNEEGLYFEAILENRIGNIEKSHQILQCAINNERIKPLRSAEKLAYEMHKYGCFKEAIEYADLALMLATTSELIVDIPHLRYCKYSSMDSILCERIKEGEKVSSSEINIICILYKSLRNLPSAIKYHRVIEERIAYLDSVKSTIKNKS